jgi:hypothetical protein
MAVDYCQEPAVLADLPRTYVYCTVYRQPHGRQFSGLCLFTARHDNDSPCPLRSGHGHYSPVCIHRHCCLQDLDNHNGPLCCWVHFSLQGPSH